MLVRCTFFKSQTVLLSIGSAKSRRDLIILRANANLFVRQFLPACIVRSRLRGWNAINNDTIISRVGVDVSLLYDDSFKLFRRVIAVFDINQE